LPDGGLAASVQRLARLLATEHEVTVIHTYEESARLESEGSSGIRQVVIDRSQLPPIAFSCEDHARSAAALLALEEAFGEQPPDYLEVPDHRGHGLVPLQARNAGNPSLRGCAVGVRLHGSVEMACLQDGIWPRPENRIIFDFEREVLRLADLVLWPGGDTLALYERFLGTKLPSPQRSRIPFDQPAEPPKPAPRDTDAPLRVLYVGRLQRARGALTLADACTRIADEGWRLTFVGADTDTASLGRSVRETIETMWAPDSRVTVLDPVSAERLDELFAEHDLLVVPSRFEVWSGIALEAMRAGLPVLTTPVGGLAEIVEDGVSGWHAAGSDHAAIQAALERLLADRDELERVRASGDVFRRFQQLTEPEPILGAYRSLLAGLRHPATPRLCGRATEPLVTGIVPYYAEYEWVREAVASLLAQTYRNLEVTIVNDGSFDPEDAVLVELAKDPRVRLLTQLNGGDQSARNLGLTDAEGKYVVMLDSDNALEPEFVARAVAMLEADPELAYVTCWLRFVGEEAALQAAWTRGYAPLGNSVRSDDAINSDGDTIAVMPRRLFAELGYRYEAGAAMADWALYRVLRDDGWIGTVIPEQLARYRVRPDSVSHVLAGRTHALAWDETLSTRQARRTRWTATA
jgi:glycosyltransferase involved in cell wall biosynthesis